MPSSQTDICNAAIMLCGVGVEIASIDERSAEAEACRQFYDTTLERLIVKLRLPSMTKRVALAEITAVDSINTDEWSGIWALPSDCVSPIRIVSGAMPETNDSHIPFVRMNYDSRDVILTNQDDPVLEYLFRLEDESLLPPLFVEALEYELATRIAPRLVESPDKLGPLLKFFSEQSRGMARACALNEVFPGRPPESEFLRNR